MTAARRPPPASALACVPTATPVAISASAPSRVGVSRSPSARLALVTPTRGTPSRPSDVVIAGSSLLIQVSAQNAKAVQGRVA